MTNLQKTNTFSLERENKSKLIFSSQLANWLLKNGYRIINLKPHKLNKEKTVYVFEVDENIDKVIENWKDNAEFF